MDEADLASITEDHNFQRANFQRLLLAKKNPSPLPIGQCHNCEELLLEARAGWLFCDNTCRDDWDRAKRAEKMNGRRLQD